MMRVSARRPLSVGFLSVAFSLVGAVACAAESDDPPPNTGNELCDYSDSVALPEQYRNQSFPDCDARPAGPLPSGECAASSEPCAVLHTRECVVSQAPSEDCSPCDAWVCDCVGGYYSCWLGLPGASPCFDPEDEELPAEPPRGANCGLPELPSCESAFSDLLLVLERESACVEGDECADQGDWDCDGEPNAVVSPVSPDTANALVMVGDVLACPFECNPYENSKETSCIDGRCQ